MNIEVIVLNKIVDRLSKEFPKLDSMDLLIKAREEMKINKKRKMINND